MTLEVYQWQHYCHLRPIHLYCGTQLAMLSWRRQRENHGKRRVIQDKKNAPEMLNVKQEVHFCTLSKPMYSSFGLYLNIYYDKLHILMGLIQLPSLQHAFLITIIKAQTLGNASCLMDMKFRVGGE